MMETILNTMYSPVVATIIASCALFVSLYVLYKQLNSTLPKKRKLKTPISHVSKSAFSFDALAINKDFITLAFVILVVAGIFSLYALYTAFEIKKYVQIGALFVKESLLQEEIRQTAAVAIESFDYVPEFEEEENMGTSTESVEIIEPAEKVARAEVPKVMADSGTKTAKPVVPPAPKPNPPVVVPPPPPLVVMEKITVVEIPKVTEQEKPEAKGNAPDITLRVLSYYGSTLVEGGILNFSVIVENKGEKDIDSAFNTQLLIDEGNDGKINLYLSRLETTSLKIDGIPETKIWKGAWIAKVGTHRVQVCGDSENTILEMNEKNNCIDLVLTVEGKETSGDLIIEKITIDPPSPTLDDYVSFSARVKNIGDKKSIASYTDFRIDDGLLGRIKISGIESGMHEDAVSAWKAISGPHTYQVCADGKKEVLEMNEENNCSTGTIEVKTATPS